VSSGSKTIWEQNPLIAKKRLSAGPMPPGQARR
jgi:hypothetical protein